MNKLRQLSKIVFGVLLTISVAGAQPTWSLQPNVVCPDGASVLRTPFGSACKDDTTGRIVPGVRTDTPPEPVYPEGFITVFGPRPGGPGTQDLKTAQFTWENNLAAFHGLVDLQFPPALVQYYVSYGMGIPVGYFDKRFGYRAAFPDAAFVKDFQASAFTALSSSGNTVAQYQVDVIQAGYVVDNLSPLLNGTPITLRNEENKRKLTGEVAERTILFADNIYISTDLSTVFWDNVQEVVF